jgi:hypothetical protein
MKSESNYLPSRFVLASLQPFGFPVIDFQMCFTCSLSPEGCDGAMSIDSLALSNWKPRAISCGFGFVVTRF